MENRPDQLALRTLEDISTLIIHSHDLQETLDNITGLVAKRMVCDVCSIYLLDEDGETLRLHATKGLSRASVGKVTMKTSEGLSGLVVEQRGPVVTADAPSHPRYKYFRETREEKFHSFLGTPLFERKTPLGVLVVQTKEPRHFTDAECSALNTIAYQVSSIVQNARLLDSMRRAEEQKAWFEQELARVRQSLPGTPAAKPKRGKQQVVSIGTPASPGVAAGKIYLINRRGLDRAIRMEQLHSKQEELHQLTLALEKARIQTLYLEKRVAESLSEDDAKIFHTHLMILEDRGFTSRICDRIEAGESAPRAVQEVVGQYVAVFARMEDPYLRERSADMEDIGRRLLDCLSGEEGGVPQLKERRILVAQEILPSDLATLDSEKILGIVTERGDVTSHASIMAKSLGIPAVVGLAGICSRLAPKDELVLDGTTGHVYVNPDAKVRDEYARLQRDHASRQKELEGLRELPAITSDGCRVLLKANIGLLADIRVAQASGAEGVGLYRSEFPYMARSSFPSRDDLAQLYRKIVAGFAPLPVNIRTLDIGGDKALPYFHHPKEDNPFMGWRSIRVSLEEQSQFRDQLAAILLAAAHGPATVMFPLISSLDEVREAKRLLAEVREELVARGQAVPDNLPVGIMVEVPAAVQIAELLARQVDYFSIGTNDLIQYTLAADRNNPKVRRYFEPLHPAVLHSIRRVVNAANDAGIPVSVCGEMAADPVTALLLVGMGVNELSMSAPAIPQVKQTLRRVAHRRAEEIAGIALEMESATDIRSYLAAVTRELLPG